MIDWTATGTMLQGIGTVLGAMAVLIAAWFGATTFEAWRKQQVTGRKLFQAERILEATQGAPRAEVCSGDTPLAVSFGIRTDYSLIYSHTLRRFLANVNGRARAKESMSR